MKKHIAITSSLLMSFLAGCTTQPAETIVPDTQDSMEFKFYRHAWTYDQSYDGNIPEDPAGARFPRLSEIKLDGGGGCVVYTSYNLHIVNVDGVVYGRVDDGINATRYFEVSPKKYDLFWKDYLDLQDVLKKESYGNNDNIISGGSDYILELEYKEEWGRKYRFFRVQDGQFENEKFESLFSQITDLSGDSIWDLTE